MSGPAAGFEPAMPEPVSGNEQPAPTHGPWLLVAAETREFDGVIARASHVSEAPNTAARFARRVELTNGQIALLLANGPGPRAVRRMLDRAPEPATFTKILGGNITRVISVGFCGALDPRLQLGDIVVSGDVSRGRLQVPSHLACSYGEIASVDRVMITAAEKRELHQSTGAAVVEMESAAVTEAARRWQVPYHAIRVVSDTAQEDLPIDFNRYRDAGGNFDLRKIALAALARPFTAIPALLRLDRNCRLASRKLGEFLAHTQFQS